MNEITDQDLISQLEKNSNSDSNMTSVSDSNLINQLENNSKNFVFTNTGLFDPANQTPTGTYVPQGTYEQPQARMMASILPTIMQPELALPGILGKFLNPIANSLARIGLGTSSNMAYNAPFYKTKEESMEGAKKAFLLNTLLEAGTWPIRTAGNIAEMFNPLEYASQKANAISNEYNIAKLNQQNAYAPVTEKYGETKVTEDPKNYLGFDPKTVRRFTPDVKQSYSDFLEKPNFQNLHNLQSQMGMDLSKISGNPNKINTYQSMRKAYTDSKNKLQDFLSPDQNALSQYNLGQQITRDQVKPYEANSLLKKVAKGIITNPSPQQLTSAITKGSQKEFGAIPSAHPLMNHLSDIQDKLNFANAMQAGIPTTIGLGLGEYYHPGMGGMAGAALGAGTAGALKLASKLGAPTITDFAQNPWVVNKLKALELPYYTVGRMGINALGQNR